MPTAVLSLPPLVIITPYHCHPSLISHPPTGSLFPLYTHPLILVTTTFITQNDGGGSVAINKYQADNPDNFIKVVVDHSIGDALTGQLHSYPLSYTLIYTILYPLIPPQHTLSTHPLVHLLTHPLASFNTSSHISSHSPPRIHPINSLLPPFSFPSPFSPLRLLPIVLCPRLHPHYHLLAGQHHCQKTSGHLSRR